MSEIVSRTDRVEGQRRIAVLVMDRPDKSMNVVDEALLGDLRRQIDAVLADEAVDAFVLASGKDGTFGAGADIGWLPELAASDNAEDFLAGVHELMARIARGTTPMVTAINGSAFGLSLIHI